VLRLGGKDADAAEVTDRAVSLYERKGNVIAAAKLRRLPARPPAAASELAGPA